MIFVFSAQKLTIRAKISGEVLPLVSYGFNVENRWSRFVKGTHTIKKRLVSVKKGPFIHSKAVAQYFDTSTIIAIEMTQDGKMQLLINKDKLLRNLNPYLKIDYRSDTQLFWNPVVAADGVFIDSKENEINVKVTHNEIMVGR